MSPRASFPVGRRGVVTSLILPLLALACLLLAGCERIEAWNPFRTAPAVRVSKEVEDALARLLDLAAADAKGPLEEGQKAWMASREAHCAAVAKVEDSGRAGEESAAKRCFEAMDRQRLETLRQMRIAMLAGLPAQPGPQQPPVGLSLALEKEANAVVVSPSGWIAAVGSYSNEACELYDIVSGQRLRSLPMEKYGLPTLRFSTNSRLLFAGSMQKRGLRVWDVHTGELLREVAEVMGPFAVSPDGRSLVFWDSGKGVAVYDLVTGRVTGPAYSVSGAVTELVMDGAGKQLLVASSDGELVLWSVVRGSDASIALSKAAEARMPGAERINVMTFSADGASIFLGTSVGRLERWSAQDLRRQEFLQLGAMVQRSMARLGGQDLFAMTVVPQRGGVASAVVVDFATATGASVGPPRANATALVPIAGREALLLAAGRTLSTEKLPEKRDFVPISVLLPAAPDLAGIQPSGMVRGPLLGEALREARVEAIGVYEGPQPGNRSPGYDARRVEVPGTIYVAVGQTDRPVVLALSSYSPVSWVISLAPGARLKHVLLSGGSSNASSRVMGLSGVEVTRINGNYAYQLNSDGYRALDAMVLQYVGRTIDRFQGTYRGERFSIGIVPQSSTPAAAHKCRDASGRVFYVDTACDALGLDALGSVAHSSRAGGSAVSADNARSPTSAPPGSAATRMTRGIRCGEQVFSCDQFDTVICRGREISCR
jgi:hypothetical protein